MSEQNKQVAVAFVEAFSRGDVEATAACLAPDAEVHTKGFSKLSGRRIHEFILATTATFPEMIPEGLNPKFINVIAEGETVVVEFEGNSTLVNGEKYDNQYCFLIFFEAGKIVRVHEYFCTVLAEQKIMPLLEGVEAERRKVEA